MARKIVVTSGKGGVGKTTVCASLGTMLASMNNKVVLVDADIGLNNLDVVMNVENKVVYDVLDVIKGKCRIKQALIRDVNFPTLYVLASTKGGDIDEVSPQAFRSIINSLDTIFDFVLIDCPAGVEQGFHRAVSSADEAIVITTPNISSIRDADKVLNLLSTYNLNNVNVVVNRIRGDLVVSGDMLSAGDISRLLRTVPIGVIPADDRLTLALQIHTLSKNNGAKIAFGCLANNILNNTGQLFDYTNNYRGIFGKIKGRLKKIL